MNDSSTITTHDAPITLSIRIDARRAQMLWHNASPAASLASDFDDRFESLDSDDRTAHDAHAWAVGTVMWCDGALEAITLADFEEDSGFVSHLLWDMCSGPEWPGGYAVLTSRPYGSWWPR